MATLIEESGRWVVRVNRQEYWCQTLGVARRFFEVLNAADRLARAKRSIH
jgi:hypothetical protein